MVASNDIYASFVTANWTTQGCGLYREHGLQILTLCSLTFHWIKGLFWRSTVLKHKARVWMSIHEVFRMSLYRLCEMRIDLEPSRKYSFLGKNEKLDILLDLLVLNFAEVSFSFISFSCPFYIAHVDRKATWNRFMFQQNVILILYDHIVLFHSFFFLGVW